MDACRVSSVIPDRQDVGTQRASWPASAAVPLGWGWVAWRAINMAVLGHFTIIPVDGLGIGVPPVGCA